MRHFLLGAVLVLYSFPLAAQSEQAEEILVIARQEARCLAAVHGSFEDEDQEQAAYSKFYRSILEHHRNFINIAVETAESGIPAVFEYVGDLDIVVGMTMQGTLLLADEYNERYDSERTGKSLEEFHRFLWEVNGCDAIYSGM